MNKNSESIYKLPVLPLRGLVVFPKTILNFDVARKKSIAAIKTAMSENQQVFLVAQNDVEISNPQLENLYQVGVIAKIVQVLKQPDNITRIVVEGVERAEIVSFVNGKSYCLAEVKTFNDNFNQQSESEIALLRALKSTFEQYSQLVPKMPSDILYKVSINKNGGELADFIANNILLDFPLKQSVLDCCNSEKRMSKLIKILGREMAILQIQNDVCDKAKVNIDESQRKYFLHEQLNVIESELGEEDSPSQEADAYIQKIEQLYLSEQSENLLVKECKKLSKMPFGSQEASVIRTYLDTVLYLPWNVSTEDSIELERVRKTLDKNHYGLTQVKQRIIEQLAVKQMNNKVKSQILCLIGPPGVGKTSIAQSIAESMNRNYSRVALGGVKDEAEIRGHRRTYIGAMPGRIINAIKLANSNNPVIVLDEIDKLSNDFRGDPTSALLEVLDPEQNNTFADHYIDIPFDLSNVFFITTANDISAIPTPLIDRMEIIQLDSYTVEEKYNIAKKHLIPKQCKACGVNAKTVKFSKSGVYSIIEYYTSEAGVRNLERIIASVIRKSIVKILDREFKTITINSKNISDILGPKKFLKEKLSDKSEIGCVNGLAWTSVGGTILPIEVAVMNGTGKVELTGSLGDVMQESAKTAISCIRSKANKLNIDPDFYKNRDIHIHAPEGAIPKDGPSAGITMATAIYSALATKPVNNLVAMTGEITLRGNVLPIGGLKEKSMAAYRAGIKTIVIPNENKLDISEFDESVKKQLTFIPVNKIEQVLEVAIVNNNKKSSNKSTAY